MCNPKLKKKRKIIIIIMSSAGVSNNKTIEDSKTVLHCIKFLNTKEFYLIAQNFFLVNLVKYQRNLEEKSFFEYFLKNCQLDVG